jgi:hypothetical protein
MAFQLEEIWKGLSTQPKGYSSLSAKHFPFFGASCSLGSRVCHTPVSAPSIGDFIGNPAGSALESKFGGKEQVNISVSANPGQKLTMKILCSSGWDIVRDFARETAYAF